MLKVKHLEKRIVGKYRCIVISDIHSHLDRFKELLKKVLEDEELKEKINVIVERKDVTYKLKVDDIQFN